MHGPVTKCNWPEAAALEMARLDGQVIPTFLLSPTPAL